MNSTTKKKKTHFIMVANGLWNPAVCLIEAIFPNSEIERCRALTPQLAGVASGDYRREGERDGVGGVGRGGWTKEKQPGLPFNISASQITALTPGNHIND